MPTRGNPNSGEAPAFAGPGDVILACLISSSAAALPTISPFLVGALSNDWGVAASEGAHLLSIYFAGATLGTVLALFAVNRLPWRLCVGAGAVAFVVGVLCAAVAGGAGTLLSFSLLFAGVGAGVLLNVTIAIAARARSPQRAFSYKLFADMILGIALVYALPLSVIPQYGVVGLLGLIAGLGVIPLALLPWVRRIGDGRVNSDAPSSAGSVPSTWFWTALGAYLLFQGALVGMWTFSERLAHEANIEGQSLATAYAAATVATLVGALAPSVVGNALGARAPFLLAGLGVAGGCIALSFTPVAESTFLAAMAVTNFAAPFGGVYMLGLAAALDPGRRYVGLIGAVTMFAFAVGASAFGLVNAGAGLSGVFLAVAVLAFLTTAGFAFIRQPDAAAALAHG